ncbi:UNVERIFIED_CONTAM: hypothetical protein FKN15_000049 [Acipenser sinensis]
MNFMATLTAVIASGLLVALGLAGNLFIVICNLFFRSNGQGLHLGDMLVTCIAVSTVIFDLTAYLSMALFLLGGMCPNSNITMQINMFLTIAGISLNYWFIAWLCVYYCVKIVNMSSRVFIRLKQIISTVICCSLAGSVPIIIPISSAAFYIGMNDSDNSTTQNNSCPPIELMSSALGQVAMPLFVVQSIVALVLMMCSCSTIIVFLCGHIRQMQLSSPEIADLIRVAKMITVLALLNLFCTIAEALPVFIGQAAFSKEYLLVVDCMFSAACLGITVTNSWEL